MENAFEPASSDSVEGKIPEGVRLPNLDDPLVIKDLLRAHAMAVSKRLAEAVHKNVRREEVVQADQRAAAFLATTLLGQNPAYAKAAVNTPERIEKLLRAEFLFPYIEQIVYALYNFLFECQLFHQGTYL